MKEKVFTYLLLVIVVSIVGEFKIYPLDINLRISLGTPLFFFLLLWSKVLKPIPSGVLVGIGVVLFRIGIDVLNSEPLPLYDAFSLHFPVFFYYATYGLFFHFFKMKELYSKLILLGALGCLTEILASIVEIFARSFFMSQSFSIQMFVYIAVVSFFRSFFTIGFFSMIILRETRIKEEEQRRRSEQMLIHVSDLYVEMIQLKKSMKNAEGLTHECYDLYKSLKTDGQNDAISRKMLKIAGEVHEMKKDHQRIYSGLTKVMVKEKISFYMTMEDIIQVIIKSNSRYHEMLGKTITYQTHIQKDSHTYHTFILLSIINNLVANAIEAINQTGKITIAVELQEEHIIISVSNNGPLIPEKQKEIIFQPGFTTKFDSTGKASSGIGLSFVKEMIQELGGSIKLIDTSHPVETTFVINLPLHQVTESE